MDEKIFLSTFALIFIAELPDKTALATVLLATKGKPYAVFLGVAVAFAIQSIVAVLFGKVISLFPEHWVHLGAGLLFLIFAFMSWWKKDESDTATPSIAPSFAKAAWNAFIVIFIAEWGDLTQLATASLAAKYSQHPLPIFFAATLALWSVTAISILIGHKAKNWVQPKTLNKVAAVVFAGVGIYFVWDSLRGF